MKIAIIARDLQSLLNFRRELVQSLARHGEVFILAPKEGELGCRISDEVGAEYVPIKMSPQGLNIYSELCLFRCLKRKLSTIKPDIVLSYTVKPIIWGSLAAKRAKVTNIFSLITGLGYAFTEVASVKKRIMNFILSLLYRIALRYNNTVFLQNRDDLNLLRQKKIIPLSQKTKILNGSGVNLTKYSFREYPPSKSIRFLMIARLIRDKGVYEFLEAAEKIKSSYSDIEFHLVGYRDDNPSSLSKKELERVLENNTVFFHGRVNDVRDIISKSDVYVLPSYREGTPRSVLEAMAIGRAIITTDAPGCRETVINGENGLLVPVKDTKKLIKAMEIFIKNPSLIRKMGVESRKLAEVKYDVKNVNEDVLRAIGLEPGNS